jgi:uncharacterized protein (TIGR02145 family)
LASQSYWEASTNDYAIGNELLANNKTLLSAVPAGYYNPVFGGESKVTYFWSSSASPNGLAYYRYMDNGRAHVIWGGNYNRFAISVRCVCDLSPMDFAAWYYNQYGSYNHQLPTE